MQPLPREFYDRDPMLVARELLGTLLIRPTRDGSCTGRIVETEAYLSVGDTSCHSHRGKSRKNATMFGPPGYLYVYCIHARHCMNVVTEREGIASAVLIRAVEPLEGIEVMRRRRGRDPLLNLTRGPARLCEAYDVDRRLDGWDLTHGTQIWIANDPAQARRRIAVSRRVGVTSARELELRYYFSDCPFVSRPRRGAEREKGD